MLLSKLQLILLTVVSGDNAYSINFTYTTNTS